MPKQREQVISTYCIHVIRLTGEEVQFNNETPEVPRQYPWMCLVRHNGRAIHVHAVTEIETAQGRIEETTIPTIEAYNQIIVPRPHGEGWSVFNNHSDKFTVYRRMKPNITRRDGREWLDGE